MKTVKRTKSVEYNIFIAEDGKEFDNPAACKKHDFGLRNLTEAFVIEDISDRYGNTFVCVMSTEVIAVAWINSRVREGADRNRFRWRSIFIDEYNLSLPVSKV